MMMDNLPTTSKSSYLEKAGEFKMKSKTLPKMKPTEVLVKVMAVGICGSDVHFYEHGKLGNWNVTEPLILGHESSGQILAVGSDVTDFKAGDRVAIEPGVPCGHCEYCRKGYYNLCPQVQFMAIPGTDGDLTQYIVYPSDYVYHIPDDMSYEIAALSEPFSVGVHASQLLDVSPGETVFISGSGPVGLMTIMAVKAFGIHDIIVSDAEPFRLETAKALGATHTIDVTKQDVVEEVKKYTNGEGVGYAFEASGNNKAETQALMTLRRRGKIAYIGMPAVDEAPLNISFMTTYEPQIYGLFRYANTYPLAIDILHDNMDLAGKLITDFYTLEETQDAFERTRTAKSESLKVVIYPNEKLRDK